MTQIYSNVSVKESGNSEVEITATITAENLEPYKKKALQKLGDGVTVPGFRPGHVPEKMLKERIGEQGLLQEAAELALSECYPQIVREKNLLPIGRPEITVLKLAPDNPFEFKIKTAIVPETTLPDYKAIAADEMREQEDIDVSQKEIDDVIHDIRKTRTQAEKAKQSPQEGTSKKPPLESADNKDSDSNEAGEELLPLTDEFVRTLGDFRDVADFRDRIKKNLIKEKEHRAKEKKRLAISEKIIEKTKLSLPRILVDSELEKMRAQFEEDVRRMGIEFDAYLKKIKKTEDELKKEWEETAVKRAKLQVIMNKIATEEKLFPDEAEVTKQVNHLKAHYKDVPPERIRAYVETLFTNEKVFEFLEKQQ